MNSMNGMPSHCPLRDNEKDPYAFDANPMDWAEEGRQYGWHLLTLDEIRERYMDKRRKLSKQIEGWIFQGKPWHVLPGREHGKSVCWIPFGSARMSRPEERHEKWLFCHGRPKSCGDTARNGEVGQPAVAVRLHAHECRWCGWHA